MKRKWKENLDKGLDTQPFFFYVKYTIFQNTLFHEGKMHKHTTNGRGNCSLLMYPQSEPGWYSFGTGFLQLSMIPINSGPGSRGIANVETE